MTPRQARIVLGMFVLLAAGITYNALYMQRSAQVVAAAGETPRASPPRKDAQPANRPRSGQETKRLAQVKPSSAKAGDGPRTMPEQAGADTIRAIQRELNERGFGPVASDGTVSTVTRAAIMSYEHDNRMPLTGEATETLLKRLVLGAPATQTESVAGEVQSPHAEALVKQVQRLLSAQGYRPGPADGRLSSDTVAAIRSFEQDQGLSPKGRISADVFSRLHSNALLLKAAEVR
jgi:peptidoglycan hydrolase-like protein with peptidoglycan-binding domain